MSASPMANAGRDADDAQAAPATAIEMPESRYRTGKVEAGRSPLANEVPIALEYNGISHAVMLATPADLEDFAVGFSLGEGIIESRGELFDVEVHPQPQGVTLAVRIAARAFQGLKERRRTLAGRTGCGICGTESIDQVLRPMAPVPARSWRAAPGAIARAATAMAGAQPLSQRTGATHGAAWCSLQGEIRLVREDVGRHNALDKLVGALARSGADTADGFAFITSRASVEMVQKAATAGIGLLAAVSAPTALAVQTADRLGLCLVGFARGANFAVYAHGERIQF